MVIGYDAKALAVEVPLAPSPLVSLLDWRTMFPKARLCCSLVLFVVALSAGYIVANQAFPLKSIATDLHEEGESLVVDERTLVLEPVSYRPAVEFEIHLANSSNIPLSIVDVHASCTCTTISPSNAIIPPFGALKIQGEIDLVRSVKSDHNGVGRFSTEVSVAYRGGASQKLRKRSLEVSGSVESPFALDPFELTCAGANRVVQGGDDNELLISVDPKIPLSTLSVECVPQLGQVALEADTNGDGHVIRFLPNGDRPVGAFTGVIHVLALDDSGNSIGEVEIPVKGAVVSPVRLSREQIRFDGVHGKHKKSEVRLLSRTQSSWKIIDICGVPEFFDVEQASRGDGFIVSVRHNVSPEGGEFGCYVVVESEDGEMMSLPFDLQIRSAG